jgi:ribosomal protein S11
MNTLVLKKVFFNNFISLLYSSCNLKLHFFLTRFFLITSNVYYNLSILNILYNMFILKQIFNIYLGNYIYFKGNKQINLFFEKQSNLKSTKRFGIYIRNFLKNNEVLKKDFNSCYLIIRFKKKNLFLTLLNSSGNVLCKSNIGSCGFKKKVKYTGFAIKRTSKRFSKKILGSFIKTLAIVRKDCKQKMKKIKDLIFINKKQKKDLIFINKKQNIKEYKKLIFLNKNKNNIKKINLKIKKKNNIKNQTNKNIIKIFNKKIIRDKLINIKLLNKFNVYRKYPHISIALKKAFNIIIRIKSSFKF